MDISQPLTKIVAKVLDVCFFVGPDQPIFSRHRQSPAHQLIVVTGGTYRAIVDTAYGVKHIHATSGHVVCWPQGVDHTDKSEAGKSLRCIVIWFHWSKPPSGLPFMIRDTEHVIDGLAHRLLTMVHEPYYRTELGTEANAYLHAILAEFVTQARLGGDDLRSRIINYIETHIHAPICLDDLTAVARLEKHHFVRRYRQLTGMTPMDEVRKRKAAYAKHILQLNPDHRLESVAKLVAIPHVATLCRLLSRYAGTTVRDIRRTVRTKKKRRKKSPSAVQRLQPKP